MPAGGVERGPHGEFRAGGRSKRGRVAAARSCMCGRVRLSARGGGTAATLASAGRGGKASRRAAARACVCRERFSSVVMEELTRRCRSRLLTLARIKATVAASRSRCRCASFSSRHFTASCARAALLSCMGLCDDRGCVTTVGLCDDSPGSTHRH